MVQEVRQYEHDVRHYHFRPEFERCPRCHRRAEGAAFFSRHDIRDRTFLVVVASMVHKLKSIISRWKCPLCGRKFVLYPRFALPHKRYTLPAFEERSPRYVEDVPRTYRKAVKENGSPIFYARKPGEEITAASTEAQKLKEKVPAMSHSTLYRWTTTFGQLRRTLRKASELIKQKAPMSTLFRDLAGFRVSSRKYRSRARKHILHRCWSLWKTDPAYSQIFGVSIFPHFATRLSWA